MVKKDYLISNVRFDFHCVTSKGLKAINQSAHTPFLDTISFFFAPPLRCHFLVSSCWKKTQEFFGVFDFRFDFYLKDIFKWYHCHLLLLTKSLPIFKKINAADRIGKKLKSVFVLSFPIVSNKHQYSLKNLIAFKKF